ncbi:MAG: metal ABC transporter solute-binding protein, Zn/Mn family [Chlamydiales bacterium]
MRNLCLLFLFFLSLPLIGKPRILVSIPPQKYLVQEIAGDTVEVDVIVPPGVSPHTYEPTLQLMTKIQDAEVWFRIGEGFEHHLMPILSCKIIDQREGLELLPCSCCHKEAFDSHIWLSPKLLKAQILQIKTYLVSAHPESALQFEMGFSSLEERLEALLQKLQQQPFPKAILVSHPAFGYFCRDFNIHQLSIEMEGKEPAPRQITHLIQEAREHNLNKVFLQRQYSTQGGRRIAQELSLEVIYVDPYAENVLSNLDYLGEVFR